MSRGRGQTGGDGVSLRALDVVRDPVGFRMSWPDLPLLERVSYVWPHDLTGINLSGLDLKGLDFRDRIFAHADLRDADVRGAILDGADFTSAQLMNIKIDRDAEHRAIFSGEFLDLTSAAPDNEYTVQDSGELIQEWWGKNNQYHRDPELGPALRTFSASGQELRREYYFNEDGEHETRHNPHGPAEMRWDADGTLLFERYLVNGQETREEGPSKRMWHKSGQLISERYMLDNATHRAIEDGPAKRDWYETGQLKSEAYLTHGKGHRDGDDPAQTSWHRDGTVHQVIYQKSGLHHRENGPALTAYNKDGAKVQEEYWLDGKQERPDGKPTELVWYGNGSPKRVVYHKDSAISRDPALGPALESWQEDGTPLLVEYRVDNKLHNPAGAAGKKYDAKGNLIEEVYAIDGDYHRDPRLGPAKYTMNAQGKITREEYWENGIMIHPREVKDRIARLGPL